MAAQNDDRTGAAGAPVKRPVRPACESCVMWEYTDAADEAEGVEDESVGTCHRWPPVRKPENKALFEANGCAELRAHTPREWAQPMTLSTDWCGEFRPNAELTGTQRSCGSG